MSAPVYHPAHRRYAVAIVAGHRRWVACDPPGGVL